MRRIFWGLFVTSALAACATPTTMSPEGSGAEVEAEVRLQKEMAVKQAMSEEMRAYKIAYPIFKTNADLCPDKGYASGFAFWSENDYPRNERDFMRSSFGLSDDIEVRYVLPEKPAAKAGLKAGDIVTRVNDRDIPRGSRARDMLHEEIRKDKDRELRLTVLRDDEERTFTIKRDQSCDYGFVYQPQNPEVNAYADGENIYITRGMYRFARSDNELALVISHELGHNVMEHSDKKMQNAAGAGIAGLALDLLAAYYGVNTQGEFTNNAMSLGAGAYSVAFEQEADYVGMYILAKSGRDTSNVANFWRRISAEMDAGSINTGGSHPSTPERFLAIEKIHQEIAAKKAKGQALKPNLKPKEELPQAPESESLNE